MCVLTKSAAFFTKNLTSYLTPIWTTVTGLSFALSGTVTEFITACSFVFSKQPYDIGDRVVIEEKDLIVDEICLLYTVFHRRSDGAVEQIAHQKVSDAWITNLSRSKSLSVKEAVTIPDSIVTVSQADLDKHQEELRKHINENPVRSRYLKALDFRVSLQSGKSGGRELVADIKLQDLVVRREDILANVRNSVRDKMEELVRPPLVTQ
jgi:small-conductance mechanosensitive channel